MHGTKVDNFILTTKLLECFLFSLNIFVYFCTHKLYCSMEDQGEIILYQPNEETHIGVRLERETIWLTQQQIAELFGVKQPAVSKHLKNIFSSGELLESSVYSILEYTAADGKTYMTKFYNLDAILSVGYRVNSKNATLFRQWANHVLKEYLLRGYSVNARFERLEQRVSKTEEKIDFFVRTSLPPVEGIFFNGQIFDAYVFVCDLIRSAKQRIILIDNYIDESVLMLMDKRDTGVIAEIYTSRISAQLQLDINRHNQQYAPINVSEFHDSHDRFLIIDDKVYLIGASIKDLGKRWFAFTELNAVTVNDLLSRL